jgi:hypothetical protein
MDYLIISIGQAGNQINYELLKFLLDSKETNSHDPLTIQEDCFKSFLIDSEPKVINIFLKDGSISKGFKEGINYLTNSSGRGNNWALGYTENYIDINHKNLYDEKNLSIQSLELIHKFIEKCDFIKKIIFIHSLNGGTGSGLTSRIIKSLKETYSKFSFIDFPVVGFDSINYYKYI